MKKIAQRIFILMVLGLAMAPALYAAQFSVDQAYSKVAFKLKQVKGGRAERFDGISGTVRLNDNNTALAGLDIVVDMTSVSIKNRGETASQFFEIEKFPQAKIVATKAEKDKIAIDLTLHGVTKTIVFNYVFRGLAQDDHGRTITALWLHGHFNHKDFGITYDVQTEDGKPVFRDEIELVIDLQGIQQLAPKAKSQK